MEQCSDFAFTNEQCFHAALFLARNLTTSKRQYAVIAGAPRQTLMDALAKIECDGVTSLGKRKKPPNLPSHMQPKLDSTNLEFIKRLIDERPSLYLDEIAQEILSKKDIRVSFKTVHSAIKVPSVTRSIFQSFTLSPHVRLRECNLIFYFVPSYYFVGLIFHHFRFLFPVSASITPSNPPPNSPAFRLTNSCSDSFTTSTMYLLPCSCGSMKCAVTAAI